MGLFILEHSQMVFKPEIVGLGQKEPLEKSKNCTHRAVPKSCERSSHLLGARVQLRFSEHPVSPGITRVFYQQSAWKPSCLSTCLIAHERCSVFDPIACHKLIRGLEPKGQQLLQWCHRRGLCTGKKGCQATDQPKQGQAMR